MLRFFYDPKYKYTNRTIIDTSGDTNYKDIDYANIDSPDSVNGHIIYVLGTDEQVPSYVIETTTVDNVTTYGKRWFVTGITPISSRKKFQISVLRDIISESDYWKSEEAYISAGKAPDGNYNKYKKWGLPFTNTKVNEIGLTISGKTSFFVFYVNEQNIANDGTVTENPFTRKGTVPGILGSNFTVNGLSSIPSSQFIGAGVVHYVNYNTVDLNIRAYSGAGVTITYRYNYEPLSSVSSTAGNDHIELSPDSSKYIQIDKTIEYLAGNTNNCRNDLKTAIENYLPSYSTSLGYTFITQSDINNLETYVDKTVYDSWTNRLYKLHKQSSLVGNVYVDNKAPGTLKSAINNIFSVLGESGDWFTIQYYDQEYSYYWEEIGTASSFEFTFVSNTRKLPKSAVRCVNIVSNSNVSDMDLAQCLMLAQANQDADENIGRIIDIQYLPFQVASSTNSNIQINNVSLTAEFIDIDDYSFSTNPVAPWTQPSNFFDVNELNKETTTVKLVSPSRASQYLFSPYNNDGRFSFSIRITLSPFSTIIYVRPSTNGLLLYSWDDKDCLIIQEDFSLTSLTSQWANYVYQNKNFQNTFNRQIQGREYERSWERRVESAQMVSVDWEARNISAQKMRSYYGNLPIVSDIAAEFGMMTPDSAYINAAQMDLKYNEAMHSESISLANDLFQYQIDNLKSQPLIPSKITTIDCKLLPLITAEIYNTNPTELNAIEQYYKYNGNRIDDYGTFAEYWGWYVRGKIIKSNHYTQPELNELNIRLSTGIFTGEQFEWQ